MCFCPTNPDPADILGRTDLDFENFNVLDFFGFQIPRFPGPQKSGLGRAGPGLEWAWALGSGGPGGPLGRPGGPQKSCALFPLKIILQDPGLQVRLSQCM